MKSITALLENVNGILAGKVAGGKESSLGSVTGSKLARKSINFGPSRSHPLSVARGYQYHYEQGSG